ncbi:hypothetical protein [Massilia aquatica]|uniref:Uncharacterized protein n=1 Tax=Massilia aquatica TaxID=2609000 RepID=A0ABX0MKS5_9BURK|nr:hypothetical protein [Massilia aquatica]NHZ44401.1 hypothetical protein [Massilia aquatica]
MSYLNPLRLHFCGRFQANPSTVNNTVANFDSDAFVADADKLWNPGGDAAWRLSGCKVTCAFTAAGPVGADDPILGYSIADSNEQVCAKIVDLDPEQQLVSEIWGLQVRIADANGNTLVVGDFTPAAFTDIWFGRSQGKSGDMGAGAMWQSVLTKLRWGDVSHSRFLTALQQAAGSGKLSIKFNCDGYNMTPTAPDFSYGRVYGTIGPALAGEPDHLVVGRQFIAADPGKQGINHFSARVDTSAACLFLDLGNALPTVVAGGPAASLGTLSVGIVDPLMTPGTPAGHVTVLGTIAPAVYQQPDWFARTAGVVVLALDAAQLRAVAASPLALAGDGPAAAFISEALDGKFVRADRFVFRLCPHEQAEIAVHASLWGVPYPDAEVTFPADNQQLQAQVQVLQVGLPPLWATASNPAATTDRNGVAILRMTPPDPGTPRFFPDHPDCAIDGQVYAIRPKLADQSIDANVNASNFISILLWSGFAAPAPLTWDAIYPIFLQYANLYPVMKRFLDLSRYEDVVANARLLKLAFGLPASDPNAMPVTRDLSPAKRAAILAWLDNPLPGTAPAVKRVEALLETVPASPPPGDGEGGKSAASKRRLVVREAE